MEDQENDQEGGRAKLPGLFAAQTGRRILSVVAHNDSHPLPLESAIQLLQDDNACTSYTTKPVEIEGINRGTVSLRRNNLTSPNVAEQYFSDPQKQFCSALGRSLRIPFVRATKIEKSSDNNLRPELIAGS